MKKYDLKLSPIVKLAINLFLEVNPDPSGIKVDAAKHLRPLIHKEVNKILDFLDSKRKTNEELRKMLEKEEYKSVLQLLESNDRLPA
jgi:hypothetical protein